MKIAVIALDGPEEHFSWSGIPFHVMREFRRRGADVHPVETPLIDFALRRLSFLRRQGILARREPAACRVLGLIIERKLARLKPDVVLALNAEHKIAHLSRRWIIVFCAGALFGPIISYYPEHRRLLRRTIANGDDQERRVLAAAREVILSSCWSARAAAAYYGEPVERFRILPMGANLETDPKWREDVDAQRGPCKLLFAGLDWKRKGGPLVLEAFSALRERQGDAELHIIGSAAKAVAATAGVVLHGRLRRSIEAEDKVFEALFRDAAFLFVPSRQEIFGLVYCEAAAFGLPAIATASGGAAEVVEDGVTGLVLPLEASSRDYAAAIADLWERPSDYRRMRRAARMRFERNLNWRIWTDAVEAMCAETLRPPPSGHARVVQAPRQPAAHLDAGHPA